MSTENSNHPSDISEKNKKTKLHSVTVKLSSDVYEVIDRLAHINRISHARQVSKALSSLFITRESAQTHLSSFTPLLSCDRLQSEDETNRKLIIKLSPTTCEQIDCLALFYQLPRSRLLEVVIKTLFLNYDIAKKHLLDV